MTCDVLQIHFLSQKRKHSQLNIGARLRTNNDIMCLQVWSIFGTWDTCQMYEYVNIRGNYCSNCTALTKQQEDVSWHIRSYNSIEVGCEFDGKPGGVPGEKNFGQFIKRHKNLDHRCSFSPASTTQHWFGAKCDV